jgi:response regulator NasT
MDLKEMLEGAGYYVCGEANNGTKAVELAKQLMPDIAILDIKMPGLDGLEVAKILHSMNIPVILLTAYSQQNFINRAEKVAVYSYLIKPITERELLPAVQLAYARWKEMQNVQQELKDTQNTLKYQKIIRRASQFWLSKVIFQRIKPISN